MAIYDILREIKDVEEADTGIYEFSSFLEDYLSTIGTAKGKEDDYTIPSQLFEKDHNLRTCANLRLNTDKDVIANRIIHYKDSFKLPKGTIRYPYVTCGSFDEHQKVVILTLGDKEEYVMAKALYYVMSELEDEYEGTRNEVIALNVSMESVDTLLDTMESFFERNRKAGIVQGELDIKLSLNYDEVYELAQKIASYQSVNLRDILTKCDDKEGCINNVVVNWSLLRKFSYVQYTMDKNNLNRMHEGNVKKQRQVTEEKCDAISLIFYSELQKLVKELG